jgi:trans-aconitate 2-methyltransferase
MTTSGWDTVKRDVYADVRRKPFDDLVALIEPGPRRLLDLGCGTAALTCELHERLGARETVAVDSSAEMLAAAKVPDAIRLVHGSIEALRPDGKFDLVLASASFHWIPDHPALFARATSWLSPGGQLAVQMPAYTDGEMRRVGREVAAREPFASQLGGYTLPEHVLEPERYLRLLHDLGYTRSRVRAEVYGATFPSRASVSEWAEGSLLSGFRKRLAPDSFIAFARAYRERLEAMLPDERPYVHTFTRLLIWGVHP